MKNPAAILGSKQFRLLFALFGLIQVNGLGQIGKDGAETVSTANVIFNRYDRLASSVSAGATSVTVNNIANLSASAITGSANNPYATDPLGYGDLIMIIKMQGASITSGNVANSPVNNNPPQSDVYGKITAYNGVGGYELCMVQAVSGNNIILFYALANSFAVSGTQRVQVVRIPRLAALTVNVGAGITGQAWSSTYTGGIVALEVAGNAVINGTVNASGLGFRGGAVQATPKPSGGQVNQYDFVSNDLHYGGEKGEGIAGTQSDYDTYYGGRYKRGAPANAGGGGNANCAGGGGGANTGVTASDTSNYKGWGNPDATPAGWSSAWNLETAIIGLSSTSTSSGGGRGGYCYSSASRNPLTLAPGITNWSGDKRKIGGGWGGRPLLYGASNILFMGGGGGAGDADDQSGGSGGNGGGIIYMLVTGSLSGSGSIVSNGASGENTINRTSPYNAAVTGRDGAGGGGGGGAIKLNVQGTISGISLSARGGNGGNQLITAFTNSETEGPGGGGGGGYIGVTGSPAISMNTSGGTYGTTDCTQMSAFTANGATSGGGAASITGLTFIGPVDLPLPVKLSCFDIALINGVKVQISWTTFSEEDMCCYELEQQTSSGNWKKIATAAAQSRNTSNNYALTMTRPAETTSYRLKAIGSNGTFHYTCTKTLKPSISARIKVTNAADNLSIAHPNTRCTFKLFNSYGQEMKLKINTLNSVSYIEKANLPKGLYFLQILGPDEKMIYQFTK